MRKGIMYMKKVIVEKLKGNEILGNDVISAANTVLISKGTILKHEYISKLREWGIYSIYVKEEGDKEITTEKVEKTKKKAGKMVKKYLEQHIHQQSEEIAQLCEMVEEVVDEVMQEEEVVDYAITVKNEKADMYVHSMQVCTIAAMLAGKRKLPVETIHEIAKGSILHDIGLRYITIPYENIDIEQAPIREQIEYKKHVIYGYDAIKEEKWLSSTCKNIILHHHECAKDGSGFPFKLKEDKLSEAVQIVAIADAFDRMVCGIGYRKMKINEVVEYMKNIGYRKYGMDLCQDLLSLIAVYPTGSNVITNQGEQGVVIKQNKNFMDRPVIAITHDVKGNPMKQTKELDLMKELSVFISKVLD